MRDITLFPFQSPRVQQVTAMNHNKRQRIDEELAAVKYHALVDAIRKRGWDECRALLGRSDALRLVTNPEMRNTNVLHLAITMRAPLDVVETILRTHPLLVSEPDRCTGRNSLHKMLLYRYSDHVNLRVLDLLLKTAPHATAQADWDGKLPLLVAVKDMQSSTIFEKLLTVHPTSARAVDELRESPFSYFSSFFMGRPSKRRTQTFNLNDKRTLSLLLMAYVRGTVEDTPNTTLSSAREWLLLHEVMRHCVTAGISCEVVLKLLEASNRNECARHDLEGNFPLHLACSWTEYYIQT